MNIAIDNLRERTSKKDSYDSLFGGIDSLSTPLVTGYSAASNAAHSMSTELSSGTLMLTWSPGLALK